MTPKTKRRNRHAPLPRVPAPRSHAGATRVVRLVPRRAATRPAEPAEASTPGCVKCGSQFIVLEPAFVHCRYCGNMQRLVSGSLLAQEEFELRSGLRLAC